MLNYILTTSQDDSEPQAAKHLIQELIQAFPQEKEVIMTFAQQLKEDYKQECMATLAQQLEQKGLQQGREEGREEGRHEGMLAIARRLLLEEGASPQAVKRLTGLSEAEIMELV
jgi:predicted transposase/invertase (TIGR01784 family)